MLHIVSGRVRCDPGTPNTAQEQSAFISVSTNSYPNTAATH